MTRFARCCMNLLIAVLGLCAATTTWAQQSSISGGLAAALKSSDDEFLKPDEAFQVSAKAISADQVTVTWIIAKGYYLYHKRMGFSSDTPNMQLGQASFPKGQIKNDEFFGEMEVFHDEVTATIPVSHPAGASSLALTVKYQGCAEAGLCYNPLTKIIQVDLPQSGSSAVDGKASGSSGGMVSEQDSLAAALQGGSLLKALGLFFAAGLVLSLTPCVLPMIPILSGIIVGQSGKITRGKSFSLAFTYVQGMALTYALVGAVFALAFKQAPQAFFQQPWIIVLMAALFVALSFAMFGYYTLQMPSFLQTKFSDASNKQKSGTYIGTFIMGALSALVVTACVAPAIVAALTVIIQSRQVLRGALALYCSGLGMGVPLLIVGASAGDLLPRAGAWMDTVKYLFGVVFLGLAVYIAAPLLSDGTSMMLWATLATVTGFWLVTLMHGNKHAPPVLRGFGVVVLVYGIALLIGGLAGRTNPLQPLQGLVGTSSTATRADVATTSAQASALPFKRIKSVADLDAELAAAKAANKTVMLDFYADWCTSCKEMEHYTFPDSKVQSALKNTVLLQADVTANDAADQAMLKRFGIFGPPTIAFFVQGAERKDYRVVGYMKAETFAPHVKAALQSA
jgi:thioredoxin:protein disulfide reductase